MGLHDALDTLFATPPNEFTAERDRLVKTLSKEDAKALKAFKKPPLSVWLVNRCSRDSAATMRMLLALGPRLQRAQADGLQAISALKTEQTALIATLRKDAERFMREARHVPQANTWTKFETTLRALSSQGSFAPDGPGRLTEDREIVGFDLAFSGALPVARAPVAAPADDGAAAARAEEQRKAEEAAAAKAQAEKEAKEKAERAARLVELKAKRAKLQRELSVLDEEIAAIEE